MAPSVEGEKVPRRDSCGAAYCVYKLPLLSPELLLHTQAERACGDEASHQPIWNPEVMKCLGAAVDVSLIECCV